jgi:chromosome segregation ATPase
LALLGATFYGYGYWRGLTAARQISLQGEETGKKASARADKLQRAAEYHAHIAGLLRQYRTSPLGGQLAPMETRLGQWEDHLRQLIARLNEFETNKILQRDMREVPAAISELEGQIGQEPDLRVRAQMQETLDGYREHQRQLDSLKATMRRTELEIDETLAEIGAIYSRLQLLDAREIDSSRVVRLSEDMEEQADRLNDLLSAMDEVYDSSAGLS